jgi:Holliday junction resolvasome RuvABC endonuclease subunit
MVKIMGLDMAFTNLGIAIVRADVSDINNPVLTVDDLSVVHTESTKKRPRGMTKSSDDLRRARETLHALRAKIAAYQPDIIIAEVPFGSQSARSAWTLGIAIGILSTVDGLIEVTPREVKTATGEPHADKAEMIEWAMTKHPEAPWAWRKYKGALISVASTNEHTADALAAIYAGLRTKALRERLSSMGML